MKRFIVFTRRCSIGLLLVAVATQLAGCGSQQPEDRTIHVEDDDPEMQAAIAKGRETLPEFWKRLDKPHPGDDAFSLKVSIEDENGSEAFWVQQIRREGGKITAEINNDPTTVQSVKLGQRVEVSQEKILDWLYMNNGKMYGNYTVRPLMKSMSAEELKFLKGMLAEP